MLVLTCQILRVNRAVAARENAAKPPPIAAEGTSTATNSKPKAISAPAVKRDAKKSLKGVLVKKKPKIASKPSSGGDAKVDKPDKADSQPQREEEKVEKPPAKRRKVDNPVS